MGNQIVMWDPDKKSAETIRPRTFEEIGANERHDLEEWIKQNPDILGERLLIITSEFDKFEKSQKRLDLLALDEGGKLVIVELKRDAAGTLADLQAIRYAASCSTLIPDQVIGMRAEHAGVSKDVAKQQILEFLQEDSDSSDFSELDNKPRILIAAGGFEDQQITTSVLWLRSFGVDISCVEITPYRLNDDKRLFLVPRVIIPLPEAVAYIEGVETKEIEQARTSASEEIYKERNKQILAFFASLSPQIKPREVSGKPVIRIATGHSEVRFEWVQRGKRQQDKTIDVAVQFQTPSKEENQNLCRSFKQHEAELERAVQSDGNLRENFIFNEDWGERWASVYLRKSAEPWTEDVARWAAEKMHKLIPVAQPLIDQFYENSGKADASARL